MKKRIPDFLVVGAMKAGTTTLLRDLGQQSTIYIPGEKEPETLVRFEGDHDAMSRDYHQLFERALPDQLVGEASTAYTKLPCYADAAQNALSVCGRALKIIYLQRNPIDRIVSQYMHEVAEGLISEPINEAVLKYPRYVNYSKYELQIRPWIEAFGADSILAVPFEDYIADRESTVSRVCTFLGIECDAYTIDANKVYNSAAQPKLAKDGVVSRIITSKTYQRKLKQLVPDVAREFVKNRLPKPQVDVSRELFPPTEQLLRKELENNTFLQTSLLEI